MVAVLGPQNIADAAQHKALATLFGNSGAAHIVGAIVAVAFLALIYAAFAVAVKRLHDRNKSAWWLLVFYLLPALLNGPRQMAVFHAMHDGTFLARHGGGLAMGGPLAIIAGGAAAIISLWAFVELYILRGTVGDNRFGPDPLAGRG